MSRELMRRLDRIEAAIATRLGIVDPLVVTVLLRGDQAPDDGSPRITLRPHGNWSPAEDRRTHAEMPDMPSTPSVPAYASETDPADPPPSTPKEATPRGGALPRTPREVSW